MKRQAFLILLTLVMVSCGTDGSHFKFDGRLLNLNQGEFYVYSPDGVIQGIDTIHVVAGRFSYSAPCESKGTLVIVFPNFSELPVFAEPGKSANLKGDASLLKEIEVKGTKENKLMTKFRKMCSDSSPEEIKRNVKLFVSDHPESLTAVYIVNKYFIKTEFPDYVTAAELLATALKAQPGNGLLSQNLKKIQARAKVEKGKKLPSFKAVGIDGDTITQKKFMKGDAVIYFWASYENESCTMQRTLRDCDHDSVKVLGINIDGASKECRRIMDRDKIETPVICDSLAFGGKMTQLLALSTLPDNIILKDGKIVDRGLTVKEIREKFARKKNPVTPARRTAVRER